MFIEPLRDTLGRTSSHNVNLGDKYSLIHYDMRQQQQEEESYSSESNNIKQKSKITKKEKTNEGEKSSVNFFYYYSLADNLFVYKQTLYT